MGDSTLALNWRNQNKEIIFRLILYAARRFTSIVFLCFSRNIIERGIYNVFRGRISAKLLINKIFKYLY